MTSPSPSLGTGCPWNSRVLPPYMAIFRAARTRVRQSWMLVPGQDTRGLLPPPYQLAALTAGYMLVPGSSADAATWGPGPPPDDHGSALRGAYQGSRPALVALERELTGRAPGNVNVVLPQCGHGSPS